MKNKVQKRINNSNGIGLTSVFQGRIYSIDLTAQEKYPINIGNQWVISFPPPKGIKFFTFGRQSHKEVKLSLQGAILIPDCWKVDKQRLLKVNYESESDYLDSAHAFNITLTEPNTYFQLFLNPDAITDCTEIQQPSPKTYNVKFTLVLKDEKDKEILTKEETLQIRFVEVHAKPNMEIVLESKNVLFSSQLGIKNIGTLRISNLSPLSYFPALDGQVQFKALDGDESIPADTIWIDNSLVNFEKENAFSFSNLKKDAKIEVPILADFDKLGNPVGVKEKKYKLVTDVSYNHSNNSRNRSQALPVEGELIVVPNCQEPDLRVWVEDYDTRKTQRHLVKNGDVVELSQVSFVPDPNTSEHFMYKLTLENTATEGAERTGIVVKDVNHMVTFSPKFAKVNYSHHKDTNESVFTLQKPRSFRDIDKLLCKNGNAQTFLLGFDSSKIREICYERNGEKSYEVKVIMTVTFKYYLDKYGYNIDDILGYPEEQWKTFKVTIEYTVFQLPYPNWLGIDFGTSAIVSQYGDQEIHDLNSIKKEIFKVIDEDEDDTYEEGTRFLSSNIVFRNNSTIAKEKVKVSQLLSEHSDLPDYHLLAVCLSPSSQQNRMNSKYALPCLKLLMGYSILPNINNYESFKYYVNSNNDNSTELIPIIKKNDVIETAEYTQLAEVNEVFKEVYRELFNYYIKKCIPAGQVKKVNKIVLTVPNTYTPMHLEMLGEIIKSSLSDLNIRNIKFVSESDAVACFYKSRWNDINTILKRKNMKKLDNNELVLIYDMGAGTLDATLFEKRTVEVSYPDDKQYEINIIGKMGICKAGNYLDTVIAQILAEEYPDLKAYASSVNDDDAFVVALRLKDFIKNRVKPALSKKDAILILEKKEAQNIGFSTKSIDDLGGKVIMMLNELIIESKPFKQYIKECTYDFIDNFFKFLGYTEKQQIDTLILSGRSVKMKYIKEALFEALKNWSKNEDMETVDFSQLPLKQATGSDLAKTVVVEGALAYASLHSDDDSQVKFHSRNIMANYGVIYNDSNGDVQYQELLNPIKEKPTGKVEHNGLTIYTYKTKPITLNLSATKSFSLVQSFSNDTRQDWKDGNLEYITEMSSHWVEGRTGRSRIELSIEVDENNSLTLYINGASSKETSTMKIDLNSHSNLMSLWPIRK